MSINVDTNTDTNTTDSTPEAQARVKIDKQLTSVGWDVVDRNDYTPDSTTAIREALMEGNTESDYLFFVDNKAIAVLEAKKESNPLGEDVEKQAEKYAQTPKDWYGLWFDNLIPLVYMANGNKIYFKNLLVSDSDYVELKEMHSPKKMLQIVGKSSEYGMLPRLDIKGLRDCQYRAEKGLERSLKEGKNKSLAILATGAGKTYLACLASYRLLNYTSTKRVLFLVDRNNLARQTKSEFSEFKLTEKQEAMSSLYRINMLRKIEDINGEIVISTIQKLFAVLTGQTLNEGNEDEEDELTGQDEEREEQEAIKLGNNLKLPPDYFQFIVVDECHRSIYGKWKAVLDYFSSAKILGLTATPTLVTRAFFNNNIIENYTYEQSVIDGVNVPAEIYRIETKITAHGGTIESGSEVTEKSRATGKEEVYTAEETVEYNPNALDRSIVNKDQIKTVLETYKNAIYTQLYPDREAQWEYVPKTLIFAKDDNHATEIVEMVKEVFGDKFSDGKVPDAFVQKITYSCGDSNNLIRELRTEKEFRIAVTVTLVATGTDVKPLEVVLFMKDVRSDTLYTQMKGRGCRVVAEDKLKEVTPNAKTKECYYIVDAVGVIEHEKHIPLVTQTGNKEQKLSLEHLLERLAHNEVSDENLILLRDYCATINRRYENNPLFGRHLDLFIRDFEFAPRKVANDINVAFEQGRLPEFISASNDNTERMALIDCLISNIDARKKLLEMQRGYTVSAQDEDELLSAGFSVRTAASYIENFEKYLYENKDSVEALRIIYNSCDILITHGMLIELRDRLLSESKQYGVYQIWRNYKILDTNGTVDELDTKKNVRALTNLIQIARYAYKKNKRLTSLLTGYSSRFALYCGQNQRTLTYEQTEVMRQVAEYVINDGAISVQELNEVDADLWRKAVKRFGAQTLQEELTALSKFLLRVA